MLAVFQKLPHFLLGNCSWLFSRFESWLGG